MHFRVTRSGLRQTCVASRELRGWPTSVLANSFARAQKAAKAWNTTALEDVRFGLERAGSRLASAPDLLFTRVYMLGSRGCCKAMRRVDADSAAMEHHSHRLGWIFVLQLRDF